jgi:hypothetical protein
MVSLLDREPDSVSYGSFDREHWCWKFRDFPLGMLQSAVYPLAQLWSMPLPDNPYFENRQVLRWITAAMEASLSRQHANGSFDYFSPNEQNPGTTLGAIHGLGEAYRLVGQHLPAETRTRLLEAARKAFRFALTREEDHGFISNHQALFAVTWLVGAELLDEPRYARRAEEVIEKIIAQQSPDGWYCEYDGPDAGYESLGISHLAVYWERTHSDPLLASLRRSIDFYAHCVHPDGSVGGAYGSRHTSIYFPGGFEILAREIPMSAAIARFMRERLDRRNVLTPAVSDPENLIPLVYNYLEACSARGADPKESGELRLPCEALEGMLHFPDSHICAVGTRRYYAVVNLARGGVCRVFDKQAQTIAYEDASYLVSARGRRWTSQRLAPGPRVESTSSHAVSSETELVEVRQVLPTPATFMILRLLSLTLFRNQKLGNWLRRLIVRRLITQVRPGPLRLQRVMEFGESEILFRDRIEMTKRIAVKKVALARTFLPIHMGSAKYFRYQDLQSMPEVPVSGMAEDLNQKGSASLAFELRFAPGKEVELVVSPEEKTMEAATVGSGARR